ncbi:MAG: zincin-like metallopeptidase domain-containing protein [Bacteroidetes bacterium]|nr:zincin-like metallopeptidase domain-containing protein [Bacteroidota bacterium]
MKYKSRQQRVRDHIELVASTLIKQIEAGTAPWQQPWKPGTRPFAHNLLTGKNYQGYNQVWLWMVSQSEALTDTRWGTYRQIKQAGGQVRRGESGTLVLGVFEVDKEEREEKERIAKERGEVLPGRRMACKGYAVFNASQADGLPPLGPQKPSWEPCEKAEEILTKSGITINHGGEHPHYSPARDIIQIPHKSRFESPEEYYAAALHELAHASGHISRMNRDLVLCGQDTMEYAREELRAEICALMMCTQLGIGYTSKDAAKYMDSWVKVLKDTPEEIRSASSEAHKMASYVLRGMGRETELPDLSWKPTGKKENREVPLAKDQSGTAASSKGTSLPRSIGYEPFSGHRSYTGLSPAQQKTRNGWGAAGKAYRALPAWQCRIEYRSGGEIVTESDILHGKTPIAAARAFLREVEFRNDWGNLTGETIQVRDATLDPGSPYQKIPVKDLQIKTRPVGGVGAHAVAVERSEGLER